MSSKTQGIEDLLNEARVFNFITGPLTAAMRAVFATVYCHEKMDSEGGKLTLKQCLSQRIATKTNMLDKKKKLRDFFPSHTVKKVENSDILKEELDIQFYLVAITQFCHFIYKQFFSQETKELLDEVKMKRNRLAHNTFKIDGSIETVMNDLKILCEKLMDNVKADLGGGHIDADRPKIARLIKDISNKKPDIVQFKKDQLKFLEDSRNKFLRESQAHLQNECDFVTASDPFMNLIHQKYPNSGANRTIINVFTPPLMFSSERTVGFHEILPPDKGKEKQAMKIIVSGQGGSGKSTLCRVIFDLWRNSFEPLKNKELNTIDLVIYIELQYTVCEKLEDYLRNEYLVDQMKDFDENEMCLLLSGLKVLVLIDGYDEKKSNGDKLIIDIITLLPDSWLIITTRLEYLSDCEKVIKVAAPMKLTLEGFGDGERFKFAEKVFKLLEENYDNIKYQVKRYNSYLRNRASCLREHLKLPLTMALLTFLWLENKNNPTTLYSISTATQLYNQLFDMLKEKLIKVRTNFSTENNLDEVIHVLHGKAFDQLRTKEFLTLTEENQRDIFQECEDSSNASEILSGFLMCDARKRTGTKNKKSSPQVQYSFFHRSQMEYYSANFISADILVNKKSLRQYFDGSRTYREILPFLAGCLAASGKLTEHCSALLDVCGTSVGENDFEFWFKLLHETESRVDCASEPCYDETMTKAIVSYLPVKSWNLKNLPVKTVISALELLAKCPHIEIEDLFIDFPNNDNLKSNPGLKSTLENLKHFRGKLQREPKPNLYLTFSGYLDDTINYLSDPLDFFGSWCKVIKFEGRLEEASVKHLQHCKHVTVKVNKPATFNQIALQSGTMEDLKRLSVAVSFPRGEGNFENLKQITRDKGKTDITFLKLIDNDVQKTINFVRNTCPKSGGFDRVTIKGRLTCDDGMKILEELQNEVWKVCVEKCVPDLTREERSQLSIKAKDMWSTFELDWNKEKIY